MCGRRLAQDGMGKYYGMLRMYGSSIVGVLGTLGKDRPRTWAKVWGDHAPPPEERKR